MPGIVKFSLLGSLRPVLSHQNLAVSPSNILHGLGLPLLLRQPKTSACLAVDPLLAKILATSQPSSGRSTVGFIVGLIEGESDGAFVGVVDGALLGETVGEEVGFLVGEVVGALLGETVGDTDGAYVGLTDGSGGNNIPGSSMRLNFIVLDNFVLVSGNDILYS
jgi:uncharacterized membrane protein